MILDNAVEWKTERILSLKSTHTTLLDDFHRYSDCVADGGKQLRSRHHTKQMTRSPEPSRSCTKSLLSVISFSLLFFFPLCFSMYFISVLLHSIRMHICRCCRAVYFIVCIQRNCRLECECEYFMYIDGCLSVREYVSCRCVCVYAYKSARHGCITCTFPCILQQRQQQQTLNIEQ